MNSFAHYINQLTTEEKIALTTGRGRWTFFGLPHHGIEPLVCGDGPHGLRAYKKGPEKGVFDVEGLEPTTLFPIATAMASTFHPELIYNVGETIAKECNYHDVDLLLAPGVNLKRSPLGGRNFEYYSEDPTVSAIMATNYINGVQSQGVGACIKHYALNEQETYRRFIDTNADDRTLHDVFLRPFYLAIKHANPMAIMSSYNKVRGDYASESSFLLQHILRDKWDYDGMVMSDWGAVQDKPKSIKNGMNIEMPGPGEFQEELATAIQQNIVSTEELNQSLKPLFDFYDKTLINKNKGQDIDLEAHHNVAYQVAKEAITLLENDGTLPLTKGSRVAVIGERAKEPRINGGGSATVRPYKTESPLPYLEEAFTVEYARGYRELDTNDDLLQEVDTACQSSDVILFFTDATASLETEGEDRKSIDIPEGHLRVFEQLQTYHKPIVVVLSTGSSVNVTPFVNHANAMVQTWLLGSAHGKAIVEVLTGDVNPSGRLTETFPMTIEQTPFYGQYPGTNDSVAYSSDLLHLGYRYYDLHKIPPRYPFGYGLSYSTFEYRWQQQPVVAVDTTTFQLHLQLHNTSDRDGMDVVQVYVGKPDSALVQPVKVLKAFKKVDVQAGEVLPVMIVLDREAFEVYNERTGQYVIEPGLYHISIARNSQDILLETTVHITADPVLFRPLTEAHPLKAFTPYKKDVITELEAIVGTIEWYNIEEPMGRLLQRYRKRYKWTQEEYATWKTRLLQGVSDVSEVKK